MVCKSPMVLIVDDEEATCELVYDGLTEEGYVCDIASNADDALTKVKTHDFDIVLLDIKLPDISGMDVLRMIEKYYPLTAVVMITGVNDLHTAVEAMKSGASDYIVKPFTLDKLNASVTTVLKNRKSHGGVYHTIPSTGDAGYDKNAKDRALGEINAIAYGVDARVDHFDSHSKIVTDRTVELARCLGLPRKEIEKWGVARDELYSERDRLIKSALSKLERNPAAQEAPGLTGSLHQFQNSGDKQN